MKVLYAIQATGNGHISRANEIIPILAKKCDLDILVSGTEADVSVDYLVKYKCRGLSFVFGNKGGIDFYKTIKKLQSKKFLQEIKTLPVEDYDLVINDFEPVSAWAAKLKNVPCIALSHQYAVIHPKAHKPAKSDPFAHFVLRYYAPVKKGIGFNFEACDNNIHTPVIRAAIRQATITNKEHYTVYLPAYSDKKLIQFLSNFKKVEWQIFSKHTKKSYQEKNCFIQPVSAVAFAESFTSCAGIMCGAGFETPAEAVFMGKKLLVVPMKHQYEQHCNAAAIQQLGVPMIKKLKDKYIHTVENWLLHSEAIQIQFPDETEAILDRILSEAQLKSTQQIELHPFAPPHEHYQHQAAQRFSI
jgi:uncharacterized protein (TIGR00661 family)